MAATCAEMAEAERLAVVAVEGRGWARGERKAMSARRLVERREKRTRRLSSAGEQRHARPRRPPRREDATFRVTDPMAPRRPTLRRAGRGAVREAKRHRIRPRGSRGSAPDFAGAAGGLGSRPRGREPRGFGFAACAPPAALFFFFFFCSGSGEESWSGGLEQGVCELEIATVNVV
jgi:hypothetical protein